ncbi:MAG TPA: hypothetical protein VF952_05385 [Chloroflexia bacterium]
MSSENYPRVIWWEGYDAEDAERATFEMTSKGYVRVYVEVAKDVRYSIYFSDPVRLQHDMENDAAAGYPCFHEPGLVVIPEVTTEAVEKAASYLFEQGFFSHLRPVHMFDPTGKDHQTT